MRFQDKVCIVTGGGSGIGKATCLQLAQEGGKVVVIDINEQNGIEVEQLIVQEGGWSMFIKADVSSSVDIERAVSVTVEKFGKIDVLVNNAAMMTFTPIVELSEEAWDKLMAVNVKSVFLFCKLCIPHMQTAAIINVSSVHAQHTTANVIPYSASKGAMEAFTRGMSLEYEISKVRINCVAPGAVDTPMLWSNPNVKSGKEKIQGVVGKPEDIARAICFLASNEAAYINGTTLVVDGGRLNIL